MSRRRVAAVAFAALLLLPAVSGCAPGPGPTADPASPPASAPPTSASPSPDATPTDDATDDAADDIALPESCEDVFSDELTARMLDAGQQLNDPSLTMPSTELPAGQALLESVPRLHCTWGAASEVGAATDVALVDEAQAAQLQQAFAAEGYECADLPEDPAQTRCAMHQVFEGELPGELGEIHVFRANAWLSTRWLNLDMTGYADDMVAQLWR
ncbi:hypothetical protein [Microbacterium sp. EF45047]|uniref:hypothetical protein n=1 Tax=Microbacterium sp. EF45047 TaxID=2809708 RepID=UPI00234A1B77|nr:hypothetical protein [Microbacterium sp. EF45047]WCM56492.1 hypothetical protein JRG78_04690 [Microbacterium sp. EF45047]